MEFEALEAAWQQASEAQVAARIELDAAVRKHEKAEAAFEKAWRAFRIHKTIRQLRALPVLLARMQELTAAYPILRDTRGGVAAQVDRDLECIGCVEFVRRGEFPHKTGIRSTPFGNEVLAAFSESATGNADES